MKPLYFILVYLALVSIVSVVLCIYDKIAAKRNPDGRIRESTLLIWAALGGSFAMYAGMLLIRHKTQHKKFMIGIPAIIILQITIAVAVIFLLTKNGVI